MNTTLQALFSVVLLTALIVVPIRRRHLCTWSREKVSTYRTLAILGLVFTLGGGIAGAPYPFRFIVAGVFAWSLYTLTLANCRSADLKKQEQAQTASAG